MGNDVTAPLVDANGGVPEPLGTRIWRWRLAALRIDGRERWYYRDDEYPGTAEVHGTSEPGVFLATTPDSMTAIERAVWREIVNNQWDASRATRAVLTALGLTGGGDGE